MSAASESAPENGAGAESLTTYALNLSTNSQRYSLLCFTTK